jgi:hypothetical protein
LLIWGDHDQIFPLEKAFAVKRYLKAKVHRSHIHPDALTLVAGAWERMLEWKSWRKQAMCLRWRILPGSTSLSWISYSHKKKASFDSTVSNSQIGSVERV